MDEGWAKDELAGWCTTYALERVLNGKLKTPDGSPVENLAPASAAGLAQEATRTVLDSDMSGMVDPICVGSVVQYEVDEVKAALNSALSATVAKWSADGTLQPRSKENSRFSIDVHCDKGRRSAMEDKHIAIEDLNALMGLKDQPPQAFFGVYDGHGGVEAAAFAASQIHGNVMASADMATDPRQAFTKGFEQTDSAFLVKAEREALTCGATACSVLIRDKKMYVAWLGDSQVMLCRGGEPVEMMVAHKPEREDEKQRIKDNGGVIVWYGAWRVNGVLSVARAIGDIKLKKWVIGTPDTAEFDLTGEEDFILLACDGLWDVMDHAKVVEFVSEWRKANPDTHKGIAKAITKHCIETLSSTDNISVIIVFFNK